MHLSISAVAFIITIRLKHIFNSDKEPETAQKDCARGFGQGKREEGFFPCMRHGKEIILKTSQRLFWKKVYGS